jgi:hypothetical protein
VHDNFRSSLERQEIVCFEVGGEVLFPLAVDSDVATRDAETSLQNQHDAHDAAERVNRLILVFHDVLMHLHEFVRASR